MQYYTIMIKPLSRLSLPCNHILQSLPIFIALLIVLCVVSCSKDPSCDFCFSHLGGPLEYQDIFIDGETLSIEIDGRVSKPAFLSTGEPKDDDQWVSDLEWLRAYYSPVHHWLFISASENSTGKRREAIVRATNGSDEFRIRIRQSAE